MSILIPLPNIIFSSHAARSIGANRIVSNNISQHEYALIFTFARLVKFAMDRYQEAQLGQKKFLDDNESINLTSLISFSSNIECFIDTFHRSSSILRKILKDYPTYGKILPKNVLETQKAVYTSTLKIRNKIQHIDNIVIGMKTKNPQKMGAIIPGLTDKGEFDVANEKIAIKKLLEWLEQFSGYAQTIANRQIEILNNKSIPS